jgi:ureidoglycolate lyase
VRPNLPPGLKVVNVPLKLANDENLSEIGAKLMRGPDDFTVEKGNFEIVKWPVSGWRQLDPNTGDEAGTTEGPFEVRWEGDHYFARNLAINTTNNNYLDGLSALPEKATLSNPSSGDGEFIYLWMSDYHPDGGQSFWPEKPIPFCICVASSDYGDDIKPENMVAYKIPAGYGVYMRPGTWHNGVYVHKTNSPVTFTTRQGRVHGRVSCSWAAEFNTLIRVPLASK